MSDMTAKLDNDGAFHRWEWWCVWCADLGSGRDSRIGSMGVGGGDVCAPVADDHWTDCSRGSAVLTSDSESEGNQDLAGQFRRS